MMNGLLNGCTDDRSIMNLRLKKRKNKNSLCPISKKNFCSDGFFKKWTKSHNTLYCAATFVSIYMKSALTGHLHQLECVKLTDPD